MPVCLCQCPCVCASARVCVPVPVPVCVRLCLCLWPGLTNSLGACNPRLCAGNHELDVGNSYLGYRARYHAQEVIGARSGTGDSQYYSWYGAQILTEEQAQKDR
jgi:hypothetical protein